ncbi:hypothetical protein NPIL_84061 [Nephila pilipes]|uniref:Uncharacterized protein n=1 Tax=Nephila pilipes TaxID=299642 RepID=A0A8X6TW02_NEPPI|nr:hypothetical protein NPIL_84061 [Nephila pilipes]
MTQTIERPISCFTVARSLHSGGLFAQRRVRWLTRLIFRCVAIFGAMKDVFLCYYSEYKTVRCNATKTFKPQGFGFSLMNCFVGVIETVEGQDFFCSKTESTMEISGTIDTSSFVSSSDED